MDHEHMYSTVLSELTVGGTPVHVPHIFGDRLQVIHG